jgi:hypothetical protein
MRSESEFREAIIKDIKDITFTYCQRSSFSLNPFGKVFIFLISFIRDFVILVVEIIFTFASLYYLRKFFDKKSSISAQTKMSKSHHPKILNQVNSQLRNNKSLSSSNNQNDTQNEFNTENVQVNKSISNHGNKNNSNSKNRKLQIMSLSFAAASIIVNLSSLTNLLTFVFDTFGFSFYIASFNVILIGIVKYILSFFIFYFFNKSFRSYVVSLFKK